MGNRSLSVNALRSPVAARRAAIEATVARLGDVRLVDLATEHNVSEMTIRRDLEALEQDGLVRRVLGGAISMAAVGKGVEPPMAARSQDATASKERIADAAAARLVDGEAVFFDGGSTSLAVARAVKRRGLHLTVVTNSLLVALELADDILSDVILIGGKVRAGEHTTIGPEATTSIPAYNVDTYVIGVAGIHPERGLTDYHRDEAGLKRATIQQADRVIAVIDSRKFGKVFLSHVADLSELNTLVTDANPASPIITMLRSVGAEVVSVEPVGIRHEVTDHEREIGLPG